MWNWDQGRLAYFQFNALQNIARYVMRHDFKVADRQSLLEETGLRFQAPETHGPWRNYSRVLKLCLLISEEKGIAKPTAVACVLSKLGVVTCDEYMHFLVCATTSPSPALRNWKPSAECRYPLLFALKYMLAKAAILQANSTSLDEIIGAYCVSNFRGHEDQDDFIQLLRSQNDFRSVGKGVSWHLRRQASESLRVIAQISYLHVRGSEIFVSLDNTDAGDVFDDIAPVGGEKETTSDAEIRRIASLFEGGSTSTVYEYPNTVVSEAVESGFREGSKVKRTHMTIERNAGLRREYFELHPTAVCDVCALDTAKSYSWTKRVLDLHHLLPLASGTRVEQSGTTFEDLVPVCPNCHRAIHYYYDIWLGEREQSDFASRSESCAAYENVKRRFTGLVQHAQ